MRPSDTHVCLALAVLLSILSGACEGPAPTDLREVEGRPQLRVAYPSVVDMEDIPSFMAHHLLVKQGYMVEPTFFAQSELAVMALSQGDADIMNGAARNVWQAASQGANLLTVMEHAANSWGILTIPEIDTCGDLQGRRFAQHGEGAIDRALLDVYISENCPGTEPEILTIPGSMNRAAALLAGEVDATGVKIADIIEIEFQAPGRYQLLANFALDLPMLKTTGVYVNGDFAVRHPEAVKDYIRAVLTVHRRIADKPDLLIPQAVRWLAMDAEVLTAILEAQMAAGSWNVNGGLDEESIQFTIDFFTQAGRLSPGLTAEDVSNLSYLNEVLDEIGRQ
jgi:ABC-type nitrate/sulfonate/bicarbonate transport system substrate-binding protein